MRGRLPLALLLWSLLMSADVLLADDAKSPGAAVSFRTDSAGADQPWYQLKPSVFPPRGSEHRVAGELLAADYIHRRGQFRSAETGEIVDFSLLPYSAVYHLNAESDLRDVPLGTDCVFYLYQDAAGVFSRAAVIRDEFSQLAAAGVTLRLDEIQLDRNQLLVIRQAANGELAGSDRQTLNVDGKTRVWKGDQQIALKDLTKGDELLVNFTGRTAKNAGRCGDIWVGAETHKLASEKQRKDHTAFLKKRGLPARIDHAAGKTITVTLLGDPAGLAARLKDEGIDPTQWAKEHRRVDATVANEELRTYNPPVDRKGGPVQRLEENPPDDVFGDGGVRWSIDTDLLLEGFRQGRFVRLFFQGWPCEDMEWGESLYTELPHERPTAEEPNQYPYRTDFANDDLPWYRLQPQLFPPLFSGHEVCAELTRVDPTGRSGQFRIEGSDKTVDFKMPPFGSVRFRGDEADLAEVPLGTRCHFYLYPDEQNAPTQAAVIMDDFTYATGNKASYRVEAIDPAAGKILLANQLLPVKDFKENFVRPPDLGHGEFGIDDQARVWRGDQQIAAKDLAVGDEILVNLSGATLSSRSRMREVWIGTDTHKQVAERQRQIVHDRSQQRGLLAWIDSVADNELGITFFAGPGNEFNGLYHDGPVGHNLNLLLADEQLVLQGTGPVTMKFKSSEYMSVQPGTHGCRGTRWTVEAPATPGGYRPGQVVRVFDPNWPAPQAAAR